MNAIFRRPVQHDAFPESFRLNAIRQISRVKIAQRLSDRECPLSFNHFRHFNRKENLAWIWALCRRQSSPESGTEQLNWVYDIELLLHNGCNMASHNGALQWYSYLMSRPYRSILTELKIKQRTFYTGQPRTLRSLWESRFLQWRHFSVADTRSFLKLKILVQFRRWCKHRSIWIRVRESMDFQKFRFSILWK